MSSDETSKLGKTLGAFALTDDDGRNYVLGLRDMTSKSAAHTMKAFEDILADVNARLANKPNIDQTKGDAGTQLLLTIKATMTDQSSCEKLFNKNLEKMINDAIAATKANALDEADAEIVIQLLNLYCGLHTLVHAAETVVSATLSAESGHFDGNPPIHNPAFLRAKQSGVARLIETTCKAFARGADEKNGVYSKFIAYIRPVLMEKFESRSLPLTPFHGSRFNILFHNGSVIYALRSYLIEFLKTNAQNGLTKSSAHDLGIPFYIGELGAIAKLSKKYTKPYFAVLEDKALGFNEMAGYFRTMVAALEEAATKPEVLLDGPSPFPDKYLRKDKWWDAVFTPDEVHDPLIIAALGMIIPPLVSFLRKHLQAYLPGGELEYLMEHIAKGLPPTNKFCEAIFGFIDRHLRTIPNASTLTAETFVMWVFNKTGEWLDAKGEEERAQIILQAKKDAPAIKAKYKERQEAIVAERRANLERAMAEKERQQRSKAAEVTKLCVNLQALGGLWESDDDVKDGLKRLGDARKSVILEAIKVQMQYRRKVLEQKLPDAKMWNFSAAGSSFTPDQMIDRLKYVIRQPLIQS